MTASGNSHGTLVPIVGPSGVGKDTLISYCRSRLTQGGSIVFPSRTITRRAGDGTEDHRCVSEGEFHTQAAAGAFAFHWQAHGLHYAIPVSIDADIAARRTVVVNVSRSVIPFIRQRYEPLIIVLVTAHREAVAERLLARGRETPSEIHRRLARGDAVALDGPEVVIIDNSASVETAGEALLRLLVDADRMRAQA